MSSTASVDVNRPIDMVYHQWTQFESFPDFMEGVARIDQLRFQVDAVAVVNQGPDQDGPHFQIVAHGLRIGALPLIAEHRAS